MGEFLGIEHRPFNWPLREARTARGWTRAELARQSGVNNSSLGSYEALKRWPSSQTAERIALALGDDVAAIFPPEAEIALRGRSARSTVSVLPIEALMLGAPEVRGLLDSGGLDAVEDQMMADGLSGAIGTVLDSLMAVERRVLQLRFGLEDGRVRTLKEVGDEFNVTPERIRQIEARALRKLRHPSRSRKLKDYLE